MSLRDAGPTEIGGFGITRPDDLLLIEDVQLVDQEADWASVVFDDGAVADFYEEQVDRGRTPSQFARVWIHTHPASSPQPSAVDEETFARVFGRCDWSMMLIVARGGASYARISFGVGPGGSWEVPLVVDFEAPFEAADPESWRAEYERCVCVRGGLADEDFEERLEAGRYAFIEQFGKEEGYASLTR